MALNNQRNFDHMLASIPIFDDSKQEDFFDRLESLQTVYLKNCRDIKADTLGRLRCELRDYLLSNPEKIVGTS